MAPKRTLQSMTNAINARVAALYPEFTFRPKNKSLKVLRLAHVTDDIISFNDGEMSRWHGYVLLDLYVRDGEVSLRGCKKMSRAFFPEGDLPDGIMTHTETGYHDGDEISHAYVNIDAVKLEDAMERILQVVGRVVSTYR